MTDQLSLPDDGQGTYDYTHEIQLSIASAILADPQMLPQALAVINPKSFVNPAVQDFVALILRYIEKYHQVMPTDVFLQEVSDLLDKKPKLPADEYLKVAESIITLGMAGDFDYARDRAVDFARYQAVQEAILKSASLLKKKRDYQGIVGLITEAAGTRPEGAEEGRELDTVCVADVIEMPSEWLWHDTFPKAQVSFLVGTPSSGKSFFTMMMAARVSRGEAFPTQTEYPVGQGQVLVLQVEDSIARTCKKRLRWEGASESNIHFILGTRDKRGITRPVDLSTDLEKIKQKMDELGNVRLLIVDPLSAYVGVKRNMDANSEREVRDALVPFMAFAEKEDIAVIAIVHLNKNLGADPLQRLMGSAAWGQVPRLVWTIVKDRQNPELRHFLMNKTNDGSETEKKKAEFVFRIEDNHIVVVPDVQPMSIHEAMGPEPPEDAKERRGKLKTAMTFLEEQKAKGTHELSAKEVNQAFPDINDNTWSQARRKLKVKPVQRPDGWWWTL
ncbi:MAG: AAA family ATPase [Deltaproteobacteria bacterium]|nr:AAA family ATPase [Deltaproteobacteria bacterium]